jgi:hypothetical protein
MRSILSLFLFFSLVSPVLALEYRGQVLDGKKLKARAFYAATGGVYEVTVIFRGTRATLYFTDGSEANVRLQSASVSDIGNIVGYGRLGYIPINRSLSIGLEQGDRTATPNLNFGGDLWRIGLEPGQIPD